ncbi:cobalt-precorrin-6A reductase [Dietzia cinnamea]|uniref:cobalt-precorrin-6A reductase n=1 Tax=Dietzia cinnamea TaxID=321318 RepID=UPI0021AF319B|nr:cobalt-precorrin-6A reductase [Dietzia cinnamea]MCT2062756.1 cobalt-precorrin-6A reductase [Dietzia cinnamea]MCT2175235.1 cobalt-precorrin-6A reductase [Dietzia cinnamea]MCT2235012.1 cobalt-precorrin-6A reductase [Dietzia cinnamea]MCT2299613.1 cobalt-precorrin-6A reductase [Dietzia cinnamea]
MSAPPRPGPDPAVVHLVGTGPGPVDLLTVRASRLIALSGTCLCDSDVGAALSLCPPTARVVDATDLSPEDAAARIREAVERGDRVVRLYAGDPAQHSALAAHTRALDAAEIEWELVPGIPAAGHAAPAAPTTVDSPVTAQTTPPSGGLSGGPSGEPGLILVLGGTGEARRLADLLVTAGLDVVTALAGKVTRPRLPRGEVRIGGFGGAEGLAHWLRENAVSAVIDATDPFADEISTDAVHAATETGTPLLRLHRPPWAERPGDEWIRVPDTRAAAQVVAERFRRPMLTVGKQGASEFAGDTRGSYLIRCSEPPPGPLPHRYLLVLDRGPFGEDSERTLMSRHRIDVLVTRDSGGDSSAAKLAAARDLRIPVVMVDRPEAPPAPETVHSVDEAARWLVGRFGSR